MMLTLPEDRHTLLLTLVTDADHKHLSGGYQSRKRKWAQAIEGNNIRLDADDIDFIRRQIRNHNGGGWQHKVWRIFVDTCLPFHSVEVPRRGH